MNVGVYFKSLAILFWSSFASTNTEHRPYIVKLSREAIPLHEKDGVVQSKSAYHGTISIGSPQPQEMDVVFDTGSGHLVVPSTFCKSASCMQHKRYKKKASTTAVDIDGDGSIVAPGQPRDQITVSFGTGEVTGIFVRDKLCLGARNAAVDAHEQEHADAVQSAALLQTKTVKTSKAAQMMEDEVEVVESDGHGCTTVQLVAATVMSEDPFAHFSFDGVLGLGLVGLSQSPAFNVFDVLAQSAGLTAMPGFDRTFAVFLGRTDSNESTITFGGFQPEKLDDGTRFAWHHVLDAPEGYWQVSIRSITANGERLDYCDDGTCRAIIDSGTSLLAVPSSLGDNLVDRLTFPISPDRNCGEATSLLEFDLGNITIEMGPTDISRLNVVPEMESTADDSKGEMLAKAEECVPMLMYLELPEPLSPKTFILGEPVLRKYYTAFNMDPESPRVAFARARQD